MFNMKGELIGINTAIFSPSGGSVGIGFAIPINLSKPIIQQLATYGKTKRGWLGVKIQSVTPEIAESLGLQGAPRGALVAAVTQAGPGAAAGFQPYDIILSFGGKSVHAMRDLPRVVAETLIEQPVPVELFRSGETVTTQVTLSSLEEAEAKGMIDGGGAAAAPETPDEPDDGGSRARRAARAAGQVVGHALQRA